MSRLESVRGWSRRTTTRSESKSLYYSRTYTTVRAVRGGDLSPSDCAVTIVLYCCCVDKISTPLSANTTSLHEVTTVVTTVVAVSVDLYRWGVYLYADERN